MWPTFLASPIYKIASDKFGFENDVQKLKVTLNWMLCCSFTVTQDEGSLALGIGQILHKGL